MQTLDSSSGLTAYGSFIALGLLAVWVVLLIPLCRARLKTMAFLASSGVFAFLIVFFWLWPTITEISIGKFGSIKTNVEQARSYLKELKGIEGEVSDIKARIEADAKSVDKIRADFDLAQAARLPRHLTPDQETAVINRLKPIPKGPVAVTVALVDSTDAKPFSEQISRILEKSGFVLVKPIKNYLSFSAPGAVIMVHDLQHAPLYASEMQKAFRDEAGIDLPGQANPEDVPDNDMVVIAVSSHPP